MRSFSLLDFVDGSIDCVMRYCGAHRPRQHEIAMLLGWAEVLPGRGKSVVHKQISSFNYWYRQSGNQLVVPSLKKGLRTAPLPEERLFSLVIRTGHLPVGSVMLKARNMEHGNSLRADVYIHSGEVSQITFDKPPKQVFASIRPQANEVDVTSALLIIDPTDPNAVSFECYKNPSQLTGWVREWIERWRVVGLRKPLASDLRQRLFGFYDVDLPVDYIELVTQLEGVTIGSCKINGLSEMDSYVTPSENYFVLGWAEPSGLFALVRGAPPGIYYIDNESHEPVPIGSSLRIAVEAFLEKGGQQWAELPGLWTTR